MKNIELKKRVLSDGTYQEYSSMRRSAFISGFPEVIFSAEQGEDKEKKKSLNIEYFGMGKHLLIECERIRKAKQEQRKKIEEHIKFLFDKGQYNLYFATFTFDDDALQLTSNTRKQSVRRILTKCDDYIMNIDFGAQSEREHYHAIVAIRKRTDDEYLGESGHIKSRTLDGYDKGFYMLEKVRRENLDATKIANYIAKLTLHSVKVAQQYVSVKKGSDYQQWKKAVRRLKNDARSGRGFWKDNTSKFDEITSFEV